jgi:class 3 adenylate cyclase
MSLKDDLSAYVKKILRDQWSTRSGNVVPDPEDLVLGSNDAIVFDRATVLYADLSGSTALVNAHEWWFAAEIYKSFLHCAAEIIRKEGGIITAYDGDRVMAVFLGSHQTTSAGICGLKINYMVQEVINPALKDQYPSKNYSVSQVVGIDTSEIRAARTGVRGDNDIVWVGRAANYAAKLTDLKLPERTWVTETAFDRLAAEVRMGGSPAQSMWKSYNWTQQGGERIYGSTWRWPL